MTGTWVSSTTAALTEPNSIAANPPLPWLPITTSWACVELSTSSGAALLRAMMR